MQNFSIGGVDPPCLPAVTCLYCHLKNEEALSLRIFSLKNAKLFNERCKLNLIDKSV